MLSVIVITKNEEKNIEGCLKSVKLIADEIIIVDSYSTDNTIEITKKYTNKIYFNKFKGDGAKQRNYALNIARGDWILSIDSDERVSKQLRNVIPELIRSTSFRGYLIPRRNYIDKYTWLKYGLFYPDHQLRLFKKKNVRFIHPLHTHPNLNEKFVIKIKQYLIHNESHTKYDSFLSIKKLFSDRHNHIRILTIDFINKKNCFLIKCLNNVYLSCKYFIFGYIFGKGFLDGWKGFRAAIIFSLIPILVIIYVLWLKITNKNIFIANKV